MPSPRPKKCTCKVSGLYFQYHGTIASELWILTTTSIKVTWHKIETAGTQSHQMHKNTTYSDHTPDEPTFETKCARSQLDPREALTPHNQRFQETLWTIKIKIHSFTRGYNFTRTDVKLLVIFELVWIKVKIAREENHSHSVT